MGTCISKKSEGETEFLSCCGGNNTEHSISEIICGKDQIEYYLNNTIANLIIDFEKRTITDASNKSANKKIKVPESYFKLLEAYSNI